MCFSAFEQTVLPIKRLPCVGERLHSRAKLQVTSVPETGQRHKLRRVRFLHHLLIEFLLNFSERLAIETNEFKDSPD